MKRTPDRGFTLIELAIALSILVVMTGIVIVRVDGWSPRQSLYGSARALGNMIRTWREKAEVEEQPYSIVIDVEKGEYAVEGLRKGALKAGESIARIEAGGVELKGRVLIPLEPGGVLPVIKIDLLNAAKDKVRLTIEALVNEVGYEDVRE